MDQLGFERVCRNYVTRTKTTDDGEELTAWKREQEVGHIDTIREHTISLSMDDPNTLKAQQAQIEKVRQICFYINLSALTSSGISGFIAIAIVLDPKTDFSPLAAMSVSFGAIILSLILQVGMQVFNSQRSKLPPQKKIPQALVVGQCLDAVCKQHLKSLRVVGEQQLRLAEYVDTLSDGESVYSAEEEITEPAADEFFEQSENGKAESNEEFL